MGKYLIGIDNGGTLSKAAVFDLDGNELGTHSCKTDLITPGPGFIERDMVGQWQANGEAISGALDKSNVDAKDVIAVATTGHGKGLYLLDEVGEPVGNGIVSTDSRATAQVDGWYERGTYERVYPKILQSIWPCHPASLLAWVKENRPGLMTKARWVLMCKDYVRYKLTGEIYAEVTDISGSGLYNVADRCYDRELLEDLDLPEVEDMLPPLVNSSEICGTVTEDAANATGLMAGTPVAGGLFDVNACVVSSGMVDELDFGAVMGTWSISQYITRELLRHDVGLMQSLHCTPGYWLVHEASPNSASNLDWFIDALMTRHNKSASYRNNAVYEECDLLVSSVEPRDSDPLFLPFLFGASSKCIASSCFVGLKSWHGLPHMLRAIYEGILFAHKVNIDKLLIYRDSPSAIRIAGGPVRSRIWMQMFADILETPLEIVEGSELGAKGAAMCAGVAAGVYGSFEDACSRTVRVARVVTPCSHTASVYQRKYENYKETIYGLSGLWNRLNDENAQEYTIADT
jgi:L-xylulokinase